MPLAREQVKEKIKELYIFNASLEEEDVKKKRKKLYKDIASYYTNWDRALGSCGITKRKLREREKFILYFILKGRLEKYGHEAIRHKNVQPLEIKERIVQSFKTIKALRDIVILWNEDKVLYELHAAFLQGAEIEHLEQDYPELYEYMMEHFKDWKEVLEQYNKRFGLPSIVPPTLLQQMDAEEEDEEEDEDEEYEEEEDDEEDEDVENHNEDEEDEEDDEGDVRNIVVKTDELIEMMIKLNYIDNEEDAEAIIQASRLGKEDVMTYLFQALLKAQRSKVKLTEQGVRNDQPAIYFALKAHYKTLENAFIEMTKSLIDIQ